MDKFTSQKISAASQTVASAHIAPKICQGQPQHLAHIVPDFIQIGSFLAKLKPNASTPFFCPVEYFHDSPEAEHSPEAKHRFGRIINNYLVIVD